MSRVGLWRRSTFTGVVLKNEVRCQENPPGKAASIFGQNLSAGTKCCSWGLEPPGSVMRRSFTETRQRGEKRRKQSQVQLLPTTLEENENAMTTSTEL